VACVTSQAIRLPWSEGPESAFARSTRNVEWLSVLCWMLDGAEATPANPSEAASAAEWVEPHGKLALGLLKLLRNLHSRDRLIKEVVSAAHGLDGTASSELEREALAALVDELGRIDNLLGWRLRGEELGRSFEKLRTKFNPFVVGLDPAGDIAAITREPCPLSIAVAPCMFVPPPQEGRHGVMLPLAESPVVQLYFGFPLHNDPVRYGIDRQFLCSGAWHYGLSAFLRNCWPAVANVLQRMEAIEDVFAGSLRPDRKRPWPAAVEEHLKLALRSHLAERSGGRRRHFEILAEAFSLPHFSWFAQWIEDGFRSEQSLRDQLRDLPRALAEAVRDGALARRACKAPDAINLTLIAQSRNALHVVVPDEWDDGLLALARKSWRALAAPVLRQSEWRVRDGSGTSPAIALGAPDNNALVSTVLERRAMHLPPEDDAILLALLPSSKDQEGWYIAVASKRAELAAAVTLEAAVRLTCSYAILRGQRVIAADGVTGGL
jgi:hypothetical protein